MNEFNTAEILLGTVASLQLTQFPEKSEQGYDYNVYLETEYEALFKWVVSIRASDLDPSWKFAGKFECPWPLTDSGYFREPEKVFPQPAYKDSIPDSLLGAIQEVVKGKPYVLDKQSRPPEFHSSKRYGDDDFYQYDVTYLVYTSEGTFEIVPYYVDNKMIVMRDGERDFIEYAIKATFSEREFEAKQKILLQKATGEKIDQIIEHLKPMMLKWRP